MATEKITITCTHCGEMFQVQYNFGGSGTISKQHTPNGCGKSTKLQFSGGKLTGTKKG